MGSKSKLITLILICTGVFLSAGEAKTREANCQHLASRPDLSSARARFITGYCQYSTGNFNDAVKTLRHSKNDIPDLADYVLFILANSYKNLNNPRQAEKKFNEIVNKYPTSSLRDDSLKELAKLYRDRGNYQRSLEIYGVLIDNEKSDWEKSKYENAYGEVLIEQRNTPGAFEQFRKIWSKYPQSTYSIKIFELRDSSGAQFSPTSTERRKRADRLFELESWNNAFDEYSLLPPDNEIRLKKGICLYKIGMYEQAISDLKTIPGPEALYWKGRALESLGRLKQAREAYQSIHSRYPASEFAPIGLYRAGRFELRNRRYTNAKNYFNTLILNYSAYEKTPDGAWSLGWIYYNRGQYTRALNIFSSFSYPRDSFNSQSFTYWRAKTLEKLGRSADAFNVYESLAFSPNYTYHSFLARLKVNHRPRFYNPGKYNSAFISDPSRRKAEMLIDFGIYDFALIEIEELEKKSSTDDELILVSLYYNKVGNIYKSVNLLEKVEKQGALPYKYPQPYSDQVYKFSNKYNLDVLLVYSLIREESRYNKNAVSSSDARGLMQLINITANETALELGIYPYSFNMIFDPDLNVELGSYYLRKILDMYNGEIPLGLASYNAGPNRVAEWVDELGYYKFDEFIEKIPITETRNYVKRILRSYGAYNAIYRN